MGINPNEMKRLSFIKYLFESAVQQSKKPQPMASQSILTFHDSAELFLLLAADHLDVQDKSGIKFMEWWDRLENKLDGDQELSQKRPMRKLHDTRGNLKHSGVRPSEEDIEESRVHTKEFFENNTLLIFGIDFSEISLVYLVENKEVRESLEKAKDLSKENKKEAIKIIAKTFRLLIDKFEEEKSSPLYGSPLIPGESMGFIDNRVESENRAKPKLVDFVKKVTKSIEDIQLALKVIALNIDYDRFVKFNHLTPYVNASASVPENGLEDYSVHFGANRERKYIKEDIEFCINFVIESAITIQELDWSN